MFILCELNASSIRNIIVYSHFIMGKCFEIRQKWMKQFKKNGVITIIDGYINLYLLSWILFMFLKKIAKYEHLKIKIIDSISIRGRHMCLLFKRSCLYVPKRNNNNPSAEGRQSNDQKKNEQQYKHKK